MKYLLVAIFLTALISCNESIKINDEPQVKVLTLDDSVRLNVSERLKTLDRYSSDEVLKVLREESIQDSSLKNRHEFRFYYYQAFELPKFVKINYLDSILTLKEFSIINVDGSGIDSLYSEKKFKFLKADFVILEDLIEKSMFLTLESNDYSQCTDGEIYIYECKQPTKSKYIGIINKEYSIVKRHCPRNSDFKNLGQFILKKCELNNFYNEKSI